MMPSAVQSFEKAGKETISPLPWDQRHGPAAVSPKLENTLGDFTVIQKQIRKRKERLKGKSKDAMYTEAFKENLQSIKVKCLHCFIRNTT